MQNRARLFAVALVLLIIACACLVPTNNRPSEGDRLGQDDGRRSLSLRLKQPKTGGSLPDVVQYQPRHNPLRPPVVRELPSLDGPPPGSLPDRYRPIVQKSLTASPAEKPPHDASGPSAQPLVDDNRDSKQGFVSKVPLPSREGLGEGGAAASRTHKVIDGDSLRALAGRYLGNKSRYLEIYDLNRDVLIAPDILPIGLSLRLPKANKPP